MVLSRLLRALPGIGWRLFALVPGDRTQSDRPIAAPNEPTETVRRPHES